MGKYILAVDQSTQGTKGLLFDKSGKLIGRADHGHRQLVNEKGWVEHDPEEIFLNTLEVCREVVEQTGISKKDICAMGISNQRETSLAWNKETGKPVYNAIVWQCSRAAEICKRHEAEAELVRRKTGLKLSPYFPASKMQWLMENVPGAGKLAEKNQLALGTVDTWLLYHLTKDHTFKTDYSNASRTQLFNLETLTWDEELLQLFGIPASALAQVCMSDSAFGMTDLDGFLEKEIPICGVLGDSHGALFGQNCRQPGQIKATYGTGSSVMMNIGDKMHLSDKGIVTSIAWGMHDQVKYVLEGNLNYTGAVISWLKDQMGLISHAGETQEMAELANPEDGTYFVPAFTGLGAPYWDAEATAMFTGITRTTGRREMVKAGLESIAYQITDLVELMREETSCREEELRVDGGPTANRYLMQFQGDMAQTRISVPELQELSGMGAAYMAGITAGVYQEDKIFDHIQRRIYEPTMNVNLREAKYNGWKQAVGQVLAHSGNKTF